MTLHPDWLVLALCAVSAMALVLLTSGRARWLRLGVVVLVALVALQPTWGGTAEEPAPTGVDVLLVIDRTTSMGAQDHAGSRPRTEGVAEDVEALTSALPAARWSVVTFDNEAHVAVPWTTDASAITSLASTMGWREETYGTGSNIGVAAPLAAELLDEARSARPDARRHVIYLGDGEQTSSEEPGSFDEVEPLVDGAMVLGYGSTDGGVMAQRVDSDELVVRNGSPQLSRIDEANLRDIASQLGGDYLHRTGPGGLPVVDEAPSASGLEGQAAFDWAWLPAVAAALVLAIDLWGATRRLRRIRREDT